MSGASLNPISFWTELPFLAKLLCLFMCLISARTLYLLAAILFRLSASGRPSAFESPDFKEQALGILNRQVANLGQLISLTLPVLLMDVGFVIVCSLARHRRPQIQFLSVGSRVCSTLLSDLTSQFGPCASLSLRLHQAVKRTFTSKRSNMLGTHTKGRPAIGGAPFFLPYLKLKTND
jgi:hypothetical protein